MVVPNHGDLLFVPLSPSLACSTQHRYGYCYPWTYGKRFARRRLTCNPMAMFAQAKRAVLGRGKQDSKSFQSTSATTEKRRDSSWRHSEMQERHSEMQDGEQYTKTAVLQRPPTGRPVRYNDSQHHQQPNAQPAQPNNRDSHASLMDFDNFQQALIAHQQTLVTTPDQSYRASDFDRLRKEILSNCWALLYLEYARPADIDPVLVVESSLPPAHEPPRSKHSAHAATQSKADLGERFTAVVANQGQPFIQGATGSSHGEALGMLLAATTEAVHANRHRFFFSANHRKTLTLERSGGIIDAGSVAGAAFGREMMMRGKAL